MYIFIYTFSKHRSVFVYKLILIMYVLFISYQNCASNKTLIGCEIIQNKECMCMGIHVKLVSRVSPTMHIVSTKQIICMDYAYSNYEVYTVILCLCIIKCLITEF